MTISGAMQSAVAGLKAGSRAVGAISANISNSQTDGYKTAFANMVTTTGGSVSGSGVKAVLGADISQQGSMKSTASATDLAISGDGFFVVSKNPNDPVLSNYFMTRAGSFTPDENGFLKNSAGYYLSAFTMQDDGTLGGVDYNSYGSLSSVNVKQSGVTAEASGTASVTGNLPSTETGTGTVTSPFISTMPYVNALGGKEYLTLSWQASAGTDNLWTATVTGEDGTVFGTVDVSFSDSGTAPGTPLTYVGTPDAGLVAPAAFAVAADGTMSITINNGTVPQSIDLSFGAPGTYEGLTQFAGDFTPQIFDVDGSEVTTMASAEIDEKGIVWGIYESGERKALYQIPIATPRNPDGMKLNDGNAYSLTQQSGDMVLNIAGNGAVGSLSSYQLESSTTDIAEEMTDMIQVQRAYSSNAKVITTADEMLQETTNLKR